MQGLREANVARETDIYLANPVLPDEILKGTSAPLWAGGVELVLGCSWGGRGRRCLRCPCSYCSAVRHRLLLLREDVFVFSEPVASFFREGGLRCGGGSPEACL